MSTFYIQHCTRYRYASSASYSANQIMLYPISDEWQQVIEHQVHITGDPVVSIHRDYFGNEVGTFTLIEPHFELLIDSRLVVDTKPRFKPRITQTTEEQWVELVRMAATLPYADFLKIEPFESREELQSMIDARDPKRFNPYQIATYFCRQVFDRFSYIKGVTTVETTLDEIWRMKAGVCQDFAHLMLALLRMVNIPARYVSGYICPHNNGMRGDGATHAWVEAYLPFYGWLGFDPTNNCIATEKHVRLAVGRNFSDCSPVKGTYRGGAEHTLEVQVSVRYEDDELISDPPVKLIHLSELGEMENQQAIQAQQ
ncbi:MAG: transglutaminase family protein [Bacteroidota bacterium]